MYKQTLTRYLAAATPAHVTAKRWAHAPSVFNWEDPLDSNSLFTEEELAIQDTAKSYCQERMLPRVLGVYSYPHVQISAIGDEIFHQTPTEMKAMTRGFSKRWANWAF